MAPDASFWWYAASSRSSVADFVLRSASCLQCALMPVPKIAAWVANKALRHRRVPLGFGGVTIRESREVCSEARVVARLCPLHELLHFK